MRRVVGHWVLWGVFCGVLLGACSSQHTPESAESAAQTNAENANILERVVESGPLKVTLRVAPDSPLIGDPITLSLEVTAPAGVEVKMPAYVEAVGRFESVTFSTPNQQVLDDGQSLHVQQYTLQAPMSGAQTIPAQIIEYIDRRPDRPNPEEAFGEVQTEPLVVDVRSALAPDAKDPQLHGLRDAFPADEVAPPEEVAAEQQRWLWGVIAGAALLVGLFVWALWLRLRRPKAVPTPFEIAWAELQTLQAAGLPNAANADAWYVRLTGAVRRYIEGCFQIPAPELTTEEFLQMTARKDAIPLAYRELLGALLSSADRVKFAGYVPQEAESQEAIVAALRFVNETHQQQVAAATTTQSTAQSTAQNTNAASAHTNIPARKGS